MRLFSKHDDQSVEITVSNRTVVRVLLLVVVSMLALAALRQAGSALVLIFSAFFLALALNSPVHWISQHIPGKRRGSRTLATSVSFFLVVAFLAFFLSSIIPPIVRQTNSLISATPGFIADLRDEDSPLNSFVVKYNLQGQANDLSAELSDRLKDATGSAFSTLSKFGSSVVATLTVLVLTFMMLIEGPKWIALGKRLLPEHERPRAETLARDMYKVIKGYVNGQVTLAAIAAIVITPVMLMLDISYPIALMLVVFVCGLIPMIGHTIGALLVTFVALFTSAFAAIAILAFYIIYQQIENYIVQPRIQANSTNMSPLLVFVAVVIGVNFGGILGGLVAIPVMGCLKILVVDYLQRKNKLERSATLKA